jgi:hypothetical protein
MIPMTDDQLAVYLNLNAEEARKIIPQLTPERRALYDRMCEVEAGDLTGVHIDSAEQHPAVPDHTPEACPKCGGQEFEGGFGLAGGGYGVYEYCVGCGTIVSKTQVED